MSEYEQVIDEIVKHGVVVKVNKIVDDNYIPCERKYVGCVVELDFSEHDKPFEDEISSLKKQIKKYEVERKELRTRCCMDSAREKFDNHSYGGLVIYTRNFTSEREKRLYDKNQELKQRIAELESEKSENP